MTLTVKQCMIAACAFELEIKGVMSGSRFTCCENTTDRSPFEVVEVNEAYVGSVNRLLLQLSSSPAPFTADVLDGIVDSPSSLVPANS